MRPRRMLRGCTAAGGLALAGVAFAQDGLMPGPPPPPGWSGTVGLGVLNAPRYAGADSHRTRVLPLLQLRWGEHWFAGVDGAGYRWGDGATWTAGLRVGLDRGRDEGGSPDLRGMGDIPSRAEVGGFGSVRLLPFLMAGAGLRYGSGEQRDGLLADLSLRTMLPLGERVRVMLGVSGQWASRASMQSQFGVSRTQALASGYALYEPAAGWRDWGPQLMAMTELGGGWQLMLRAEQQRLLDGASASPLVRDRRNTSGMLTLGNRF